MEIQKSSEVSQYYACGRCGMAYYQYRQLLEHLYWKHGTESEYCNKCCLKKWKYAAHICNILPMDDIHDENGAVKFGYEHTPNEDTAQYCLCGQTLPDDAPMIGCDEPRCRAQWYHYECVGIVNPPDGDWICPICVAKSSIQGNTRG